MGRKKIQISKIGDDERNPSGEIELLVCGVFLVAPAFIYKQGLYKNRPVLGARSIWIRITIFFSREGVYRVSKFCSLKIKIAKRSELEFH